MSIHNTSFTEIKVYVAHHTIEPINNTLLNSLNQFVSDDELSNILQISWIIQISKQNDGQEPQMEEQIYTPFNAFRELLSNLDINSNDSPENQQLSDFCEEKRYIDLDGSCQIEVSWEGKIKISNHNKEPFSYVIESLEQVFIDDLNVFRLLVLSPSTYVIGNALIDEFYIRLNQIQDIQTPTLELSTNSSLSIHQSEVNGLINNKGIIHLQDSGFLKVQSLLNEGKLNCSGKFAIDTANLFWNFGSIHSKNLRINANIFYQLQVEGFNPIIDAAKLKIQTFEELKIIAGEVSVNSLKITCLGSFESESKFKGNDFVLNIQNPSINKGSIDFEKFDFKSFSNFINEGIIHAEKTAIITMEPGQTFLQANTFITPELSIKGDEISFKNYGNILVNKFNIYNHLIFENNTPLPSIENKNEASNSNENEAPTSNENNNASPEENNQQHIMATFDEVSILCSTSEWTNNGLLKIKNGKINMLNNNGLLESDNLSVMILNQTGKMNVSDFNLGIKGYNEGSITVKIFDGNGKLDNKGNFTILEEANVDFTTVDQKGVFYAHKIKGKVNQWNEFNKSYIHIKTNFNITNTVIDKNAFMEISGILKGHNFNDRGTIYLNGGILTTSQTFIGAPESKIILKSGGNQFDADAKSYILTSEKNAGIITQNFAFKGSLSSYNGLINKEILFTQQTKLNINGNLYFKGKTAFDSFQNTDFKSSTITGLIEITDENSLINITKPINLNIPFILNAQNISQCSPINVKKLNLTAKKATLNEELVVDEDLNIFSNLLETNSLVLSQKDSISIESKEFKNKGKIVTKKAPLKIKAIDFETNDSLISEHSIFLKINNISIEIEGNVSAPIIDILINILINKGSIQSEVKLKIDSNKFISNLGKMESNKLLLTAKKFNNSQMIFGGDGSEFIVKEEFTEDENSTIILNNSKIVLPNPDLKLKGQLILKSPTWEYYKNEKSYPIVNHWFDIDKKAKLILMNYNFKWNHFYNHGTVELHDSIATGTNIYYAGKNSVTSFFGVSELIAPKFYEYGITRSPNGICLMCGSGVSKWGKYEVNGPTYFNIQEGVSDNDASLNILEIANPSAPAILNQIKEETFSNTLLFSKKSMNEFFCDEIERIFFINCPSTNLLISRNAEFTQSVEMRIHSFKNLYQFSSYGLMIESSNDIDNSGLINSNGYLQINSKNVNNLPNGQIAAMYNVEITVTNEFKNCNTANRILSQNGDVIVYSHSKIDNRNGTLEAGGAISLYSDENIDNTAGLMLAKDPTRESIFCAPQIINSCDYKTETKKNITTYIPTSNPGEIVVRGNCQIAGKLVLEGGNVYAGGKIFNDVHEPFSFEPKAIGEYKGCFLAHTADLVLNNLISKGSKFAFGPGGLKVQANGEVYFNKSPATKNDQNQLTNIFDVVKLANRFPSLFNYRRDGTICLRCPVIDNSEWNLSNVVFTSQYNHKKPIQFMVSPNALQSMISFIPTQMFGVGSVSPDALFALIHQNAEKKAINHVLSKEIALRDTLPSLTWELRENRNSLMAYPYIIIPNKIDSNADIISQGKIIISSTNTMNLDGININSVGDVILSSKREVTQNGGLIASEGDVIIKSKNISHNACKETKSNYITASNCYKSHREEIIKDLPKISAKTLKENGNTTAEGIQIIADKYDHENGSLKINPVILNIYSYGRERNNSIYKELTDKRQVGVLSNIRANYADFHGDTTLKGTNADIGEIKMYSNLTFEAQKLSNEYDGKAVKHGFWRKSTMLTNGVHQILLQTQVRGKVLKDMTENTSVFTMRSSVLDVLKTEIKSDIKQEAIYCRNYDNRTVKTSGISFPWSSDPKPLLYKSIKSLLDSNTGLDVALNSIRAISSFIKTLNDGLNLLEHGKSYGINMLKGMVYKATSFTIGTKTEVNFSQRSFHVPNIMRGEVLNIKNQNTNLVGSVEFKDINIDTENFNIDTVLEETNNKQEVTQHGFTFNPIAAIKSHNVAGVLPRYSYYSGKNELVQRRAAATHIIADKMRINVKNDMNIHGVKVEARDFEGNVGGNLNVESIQDMYNEEGSQKSLGISFGSIASIGKLPSDVPGTALNKFTNKLNNCPLNMVSFSHQSHKEVHKKVNFRAGIVGNEHFKLNVGGKITKKSADVGLLENGKITDKGVNAKEIISETLPDEDISEKSIFYCPIAEITELFGAVNEMVNIHRYAYQFMKRTGMSDRDAIEQLNNPHSAKVIKTMAGQCEQIVDKMNNFEEKYETLIEKVNNQYNELISNDEPNSETNIENSKQNEMRKNANEVPNIESSNACQILKSVNKAPNNDNSNENYIFNNGTSLSNELLQNCDRVNNMGNSFEDLSNAISSFYENNNQNKSSSTNNQVISLNLLMEDNDKFAEMESKLAPEKKELLYKIRENFENVNNEKRSMIEEIEYDLLKMICYCNKKCKEFDQNNPKTVQCGRSLMSFTSKTVKYALYFKAAAEGWITGSEYGSLICGLIGECAFDTLGAAVCGGVGYIAGGIIGAGRGVFHAYLTEELINFMVESVKDDYKNHAAKYAKSEEEKIELFEAIDGAFNVTQETISLLKGGLDIKKAVNNAKPTIDSYFNKMLNFKKHETFEYSESHNRGTSSISSSPKVLKPKETILKGELYSEKLDYPIQPIENPTIIINSKNNHIRSKLNSENSKKSNKKQESDSEKLEKKIQLEKEIPNSNMKNDNAKLEFESIKRKERKFRNKKLKPPKSQQEVQFEKVEKTKQQYQNKLSNQNPKEKYNRKETKKLSKTTFEDDFHKSKPKKKTINKHLEHITELENDIIKSNIEINNKNIKIENPKTEFNELKIKSPKPQQEIQFEKLETTKQQSQNKFSNQNPEVKANGKKIKPISKTTFEDDFHKSKPKNKTINKHLEHIAELENDIIKSNIEINNKNIKIENPKTEFNELKIKSPKPQQEIQFEKLETTNLQSQNKLTNQNPMVKSNKKETKHLSKTTFENSSNITEAGSKANQEFHNEHNTVNLTENAFQCPLIPTYNDIIQDRMLNTHRYRKKKPQYASDEEKIQVHRKQEKQYKQKKKQAKSQTKEKN